MASNATVIIIRPPGYDEYGDPIAGAGTSTPITGATVAPRVENELTARGRAGVIGGLTVYMPAGTDLLHSDRVQVDGVLYEVDGEPGTWTSPFTGLEHGVEVALRRGEG